MPVASEEINFSKLWCEEEPNQKEEGFLFYLFSSVE